MKLYYAPGTCSLSPHIVAREAGLPLTLVRVDNKNKKTESGEDYRAINPKGYVPLLELDNGTRLSEGPAIVQYLADLAPAAKLAPANGTFERYQLQEWLNFITSEIHKQFSPLFDATMPEEAKEKFRNKLASRFDWVVEQLRGRDYLMGSFHRGRRLPLRRARLDEVHRARSRPLACAAAVRRSHRRPATRAGSAEGGRSPEVTSVEVTDGGRSDASAPQPGLER